MNRAELIARASLPCHYCGEPIQRIETRWIQNGDGNWAIGPTYAVCTFGHRTLVELVS